MTVDLLSDRAIVDEFGATDRVACVVCLMPKGKRCTGVEPGQIHEARKLALALLTFPTSTPMQGSAGWP